MPALSLFCGLFINHHSVVLLLNQGCVKDGKWEHLLALRLIKDGKMDELSCNNPSPDWHRTSFQRKHIGCVLKNLR